MTVIAFLPQLNLAFSDALLSVDKPGGSNVPLPTTGSTVNLPTHLSISPTKLVRKIHRLKFGESEVVMLLAGTVSHLKRIIYIFEEIRCVRQEIPQEIGRGLNLQDPLSILNVAIKLVESSGFNEFEIIAFHKGRCFDHRFDTNRSLGQTAYFGEAIFAGSGSVDLYRWLCDRGEQYMNIPSVCQDSLEQKILRTQNLVPSLLLEEDTRATLKTINNGVGGYYETFYIDNSGLHPQDEVLTIFAAIEGEGKKTKIVLRRLFFHLYSADCLLIISFHGGNVSINIDEKVRLNMSDFELFKIKPLLDDSAEPNWGVERVAVKLPSAKHHRLSLYRETDENNPQIKRFSHGVDNGESIFSISVKNKYVFLTLEKDRLDYYLKRFPSKSAENETLKLGS